MKVKKWFRRFVSLVSASALICMSTVGAYAVNQPPTDNVDGGYTYNIEMINDTDFIITGYTDGVVSETVEGSIGGQTLHVTYFGSARSISDEVSTSTEDIDVSSIITKADTDSVADIEPIQTYSEDLYAGSVTYRMATSSGGYIYPQLFAYYSNQGSSYVSDYNLNARRDDTISILAGALLIAVGVKMPHEILAAVVGFLGGFVSSGKVTSAASGTFKGTQYDYNVKIQDKRTSPDRYEIFSGTAFNGDFKPAGGYWSSHKAYADIYPQFIREKDAAVAGIVFGYFYDGHPTVTSWSNSF